MELNETRLSVPLNCTVATDAFMKKMFYAVVVPSSLSIAGAILVIIYSLIRIWNVTKIVRFICRIKQQERQQLLPEESPSPGYNSHHQPGTTTPPSNPQSTNLSESNEFAAAATDTDVTAIGGGGVCTAINHPSAHLLLYISFADVIVAMSHIWGVSMTREDLAEQSKSQNSSESWLTECGAQAVFAVFGTIASFLWTLVLAFMAVVMASEKINFRSLTKSTFCFSLYHILLWGIPTAVAVGFGVQGRLGFDQKLDVGIYVCVQS